MLTCANCGAENPIGKRFCGDCGNPLAAGCPTCDAENPPGKKFCGDCGSPLSAAPTPDVRASAVEAAEAPATERRLVSVLFADLVGFTSLSEARDAEEVRELLSRYFDNCRRLIELYGGTVEKFIGDAVMAVWGTPTATEDDAERAVRAALDLVASVSALGDEVGASELRARAAVLTGEAAVTVGATGQGMVAGDLVNTASRVQSTAEPGSVLVGEATRRATESAIVYQDLGSVELRGKEEDTRLWRALRVVSGVRGQLKSEGLEPPFVGRERELRQIKDLFHVSADERRAQLVSVTGIAGIGKSRLAWEFYKYIDGLPQTTYWHRGRCLAYGEGVTYWALADMVRMRCRIAEDDDPTVGLQKLQAALEEHLLDPEERRFVEPRLAHLLGLSEQQSRERGDLFAAWRLFFERLAETYPTVLAFEDMQWADASLLDFVEHLLEWSRNYPLFVITLARPELAERRPTWGAGHRNFTSLYLDPLSEEAMQALLAGLVPGLPTSLRTQILARAEGVPLYAVETVRMLLDRGLLVEEGSAYRVVGEVESLEVPETLHALVAARLDGLSPDERRLVQDAAVLGKTFTPAALGSLTGLDRATLEQLLTGLVRREVLTLQSDPRSPEQGQYGFLQDLLRHVAYETLPKRERRNKHLAAAEFLSLALGEDEVAEVVAAHLVDAYRIDPDADDASPLKKQARTALGRAGERAASLGASVEALRYFEQAAELTDEPEEHAAALNRAGQMAAAAGDNEHACSLFEQAIALYDAIGDTHGAAAASTELAVAEGRMGRSEQAIERMEKSYAVVRADEPDADVAYLLARLGAAHYFAGDPERAAECIELALDLGEALQLPLVLCRGWMTKATIMSARRPEESTGLLQLALDTALAHDLHEQAATAGSNLSDSSFRDDRYIESLAYLEQVLDLGRTIGIRNSEWFALSEMTYALAMLGRWDEAFARLAELPDEQIGANTAVISPMTSILEIYLHRGEIEQAKALLARFADISSADIQTRGGYDCAESAVRLAEGNPREALAIAEQVLAEREVSGLAAQNVKLAFVHAVEAALALGDAQKADDLLSIAEQEPPGLRAPFLTAMVRRFRARLAGGDPAAEHEFKAAAAQLAELELPFYRAVVQLEYGEWLTAQGCDESAELLAEAREMFERLETTPWIERVDAVSAPARTEIPA